MRSRQGILAVVAIAGFILVGEAMAIAVSPPTASDGMPTCPPGHYPGPTACDACRCAPTPTPPGNGISEARAIVIAMRQSAANGDIQPSARLEFDRNQERWVWHVSWAFSAGPTSGEYCDILVDYFSGEVVGRNCMYS